MVFIANQSEAAFRQEVWLSVVLIPLAFFLAESAVDRVLLITPIFLVLIVENFIQCIKIRRFYAKKNNYNGI
jgi:diacylglycerol kinase